MSAKPLILACSLLAVTHAHGEDELSCAISLGRPLAIDSPLRDVVLDDPETIQLEAGQFEAQMGDNPTASMSGGVLLLAVVLGLGCATTDRKRYALEPEEFRTAVQARVPEISETLSNPPFVVSDSVIEKARAFVEEAPRGPARVEALLELLQLPKPAGFGLRYHWNASSTAAFTE